MVEFRRWFLPLLLALSIHGASLLYGRHADETPVPAVIPPVLVVQLRPPVLPVIRETRSANAVDVAPSTPPAQADQRPVMESQTKPAQPEKKQAGNALENESAMRRPSRIAVPRATATANEVKAPTPAPAPAKPSARAVVEPFPPALPAVSSPPIEARPATAAALTEPFQPPRVVEGYSANQAPTYPRSLRRRGIEGKVLVRAAVDIQGRCERVEIVRSSGYSLFDQAALEAVERWHFQPARRGERVVTAAVEIPIVFRLSGS
ncbi:MAG: energy transducer TonB [Chromatiales bacterium]|nr:energy transducer TonB [Chromatiales bacterium]